jgi:hypothetical protein
MRIRSTVLSVVVTPFLLQSTRVAGTWRKYILLVGGSCLWFSVNKTCYKTADISQFFEKFTLRWTETDNWRRGQTLVIFGKKIPASPFAVGFLQLSTTQGETLLFALSLAHSRVPLCAVLLTSSYLASLVYVILLYCVCYNLPLWNSYLQQSALGSIRCLLNI